jgi:predicted acyl esterase
MTRKLSVSLCTVAAKRRKLQVSTTGTDADWIVKVIDVFPSDEPETKKLPLKDE